MNPAEPFPDQLRAGGPPLLDPRWLPFPAGRTVWVPNLPGFRYSRTEAFATPVVPPTWVDIFVFEPFQELLAKAGFLRPNQTHPACEFVLVPGGSFVMGSVDCQHAKPLLPVTIEPFLMGRTTLVEGLGRPRVFQLNEVEVRPLPPPPFETLRPLSSEPWLFFESFAGDFGLRLPSESEWEYACRARSASDYCFGDNPRLLRYWGWHRDTAPGATFAVACLEPNAFGLFDMHGNVWEWCADTWANGYRGTPTDGQPRLNRRIITPSTEVTMRGGCFTSAPRDCMSASRWMGQAGGSANFLGARMARSIDPMDSWHEQPLRRSAFVRRLAQAEWEEVIDWRDQSSWRIDSDEFDKWPEPEWLDAERRP